MKKNLWFKRFYFLMVLFAIFLGANWTPANADVIVDNDGPGTSAEGTWKVSGGTLPIGSDSKWARDGATYTWSMNSQPEGTYEVYMWWTALSSRSSNIPVTIVNGGPTASFNIDQSQNAAKWNSLGKFYFDGSGSVTITAAYGSSVSTCADAVWFRQVLDNPPNEIIIDNRELLTLKTGSWSVSGGSGYYGEDSLWSRDGTTFTWLFVPPQSGEYDLSMWWTEFSSRGSNVPVSIQHAQGTETKYLNQQENGGQWNYLDTYSFEAGNTYFITITSMAAPYSTCADAVKFTLATPGNIRPTAVIDSISPSSATFGQSVSFEGHGEDSDGTIEGYRWTSDKGGTIGSSASFSKSDLTVGTHIISLVVIDDDGSESQPVSQNLVIEPDPSNSAPTAVIDSISPSSATFGQSVSFAGHGEDSDGTIEGYRWTSDKDGTIGSSASFSKSDLTVGTHIISLVVIDDDGSESQPVSQNLVIQAVVSNSAPTAVIDSISPNPVNAGQAVSFTGHGVDTDGTIQSYRWTSDKDGTIGSSASFSKSDLSVGTHIIRLVVTDDKMAVSAAAQASLVVNSTDVTVIIDNRSSTISKTGTWQVSSATGFYGSDSEWGRDGATFTWRFRPTISGLYQVSMWWTEWPSRSTNIPVVIQHAGGSANMSINQQQDGEQWNLLGAYNFQAGTEYTVRITSQAYPTSTCADAVKFTLLGSGGGNLSPVARNDVAETNAGTSVTIDVAGNDYDPDGTLNLSSVTITTSPANGTVVNRNNGTVTYTPSSGYTGVDTFRYRIRDNENALSNIADVTVNIQSVSSNVENIYACFGYASTTKTKSNTISMLRSIGAYERNGVWIYENRGKVFNIRFVEDVAGMRNALRTKDAHILFQGHSNYGLGAVFATPQEFSSQTIENIYYVDDDRILNCSSPWIGVSIRGMISSQAYPNWWPEFKDGTSAVMPYRFDDPKGDPAYNYYITYQIPGDPTHYRIETAKNGALERFAGCGFPPWYDASGRIPNPDISSHRQYFIVTSTSSSSIADTNYISVGATTATLQAEFSITSGQEGGVPLVTSFEDKSSGDVVAWEWDFGDGEISYEQNPTHTYYAPGAYNVSLTVTGQDGEFVTETKENIIQAGTISGTLAEYPDYHYARRTILFRRQSEVRPEEMQYKRMLYVSCTSGLYYTDIFQRGIMFYTLASSWAGDVTLPEYLKAYMEGKSDQEIWRIIQNIEPLYDYYNFNKKPSEQ